MKTHLILPSIPVVALVTTLFALPSSVIAGPGINYWHRMSEPRSDAVATEKLIPLPATMCVHQTVTVTQTKKEWPSARGPLVATAAGAKRVCTSCGGTARLMKRTWLNGKGPMVKVEVPAQHNCVACGVSEK